MKLDIETKSTLWSILEKYDNNTDYSKFCDSISNMIQGKNDSINLLVIYNHFRLLDKDDIKKIDSTIGSEMSACLFSI